MIIVIGGSVKCDYTETSYLTKGDSIMLSCTHSLHLKCDEQQATGYIIEFQTNIQNKMKLNQDLQPYRERVIRVKSYNNILFQVDELYRNIDSDLLQTQLENQISFLNLIEKYSNSNMSHSQLGDTMFHVNDSIKFIHKLFMNKLTIEQLAENANISVRQYLRVFKKITAMTPISYINQYRIFRAQELLLQKDEPVQKIALDVGFEDVSYFNRLFKRRVGCTPKEYICLKQSSAKILTLHYAGELLSLGIIPIGDLKSTLNQIMNVPKGIIAIDEDISSIQMIKELEPDIVILSDAIEVEIREEIEKNVPVILIPWDEHATIKLKRIARILGKTAEANQYISDFEESRKALKFQNTYEKTQHKTISILRLDENKLWIHASRFFPFFYKTLQFKPSKLMMETTEVNLEIRRFSVPFNSLASIESDRLYIVEGIESEFYTWLESLIQTPQWQQLTVVKNDEVYVLRQNGISSSIYNQQQLFGEIPQLISGNGTISDEGLLIGKLSTYLVNKKSHFTADNKNKVSVEQI